MMIVTLLGIISLVDIFDEGGELFFFLWFFCALGALYELWIVCDVSTSLRCL